MSNKQSSSNFTEEEVADLYGVPLDIVPHDTTYKQIAERQRILFDVAKVLQPWHRTSIMLKAAVAEQAPICWWGGVAPRKSPFERFAWHVNKALKPLMRWFEREEESKWK